MIIKGGARGSGAALADHLERADTNERVQVVELRDVAGVNLDEALREMEALGGCTRCKKPLYHANIDPRADEVMTPQQWARAVDALEENLGLKGQPRAVVQHIKDGREHTHVVWSRIDVENRRAISDSHNYRKHEEVSRALEREFGHDRVQGAHAERDGVERMARTPTHAEMQQAARTGIDPQAMKAELSGLWRQTDTGKAFAAAVEDAGYSLARGDKRDFIIVDQAGEVHSLARRIDGAKAKDLRARMADVDPAGLPDADAAKAIQAERARARDEQAGRAAAVEPAPVLAVPAEALEPTAPVREIGPADAAGETVAEGVAPAEPEPTPEPATFVESVTAALDAQRRQLLAILRRVWEHRAEALAAPAIEPETPAAAPLVLPDPEKLEQRRQLLDAVQAGRKRPPEAAPVEAAQPAEPEPAPLPPALPAAGEAGQAVPAVDPPQIDASAARRQLADAQRDEAEAKRREAQRAAEADAERRSRDPRIAQEESQLVAAQARQDAAERKALEAQHAAEWQRLEKAEATRAKRDGIEEARIARAETAEDKAGKRGGLFGRLKTLLSPAAARERQEEQERIDGRRAQDRDDRLAARQERDAQERAGLDAAQARARESAEDASAARHARALEELRQRQRDRDAWEQERGIRERDGRGGRGDDGRGGRAGRDDGGRGGWER
jgi:hypothetical protein